MARDPWDEFKAYDPNEQRKDWDLANGEKRYEVTVKIGTLVSFFKKLFGKGKRK